MAEAYSLNVNWGDILFEKAVKEGSEEYVAEMVAAGHLTTQVFRAVVDRYVCPLFTHIFRSYSERLMPKDGSKILAE